MVGIGKPGFTLHITTVLCSSYGNDDDIDDDDDAAAAAKRREGEKNILSCSWARPGGTWTLQM
jgi:hypothetical protein